MQKNNEFERQKEIETQRHSDGERETQLQRYIRETQTQRKRDTEESTSSDTSTSGSLSLFFFSPNGILFSVTGAGAVPFVTGVIAITDPVAVVVFAVSVVVTVAVAVTVTVTVVVAGDAAAEFSEEPFRAPEAVAETRPLRRFSARAAFSASRLGSRI